MPSSLIIVGLAAAWLVVLVPMVARKRQEITQTNDSALAARVVRSGSTRNEWRREFAVSRDAKTREDLAEAEYDEDLDDYDAEFDDADDTEPEPEPEPVRRPVAEERPARRYRPGRGGFDPEAAEMAARAKYAFRQRVVLGLIIAAVLTAIVAAVVLPVVWWAHGAVDVTLAGYLVYLRRQVRIEEEIRQRRMARYAGAARRPVHRPESEEHIADVEVARPRPRRELVNLERRQAPPAARPPRNAVVVDLDDEDPAFHELDDPGELPYRRAAGE
ncbi:gephyrin-like molybdotransferase receptor GlpR [Prauserella oleivorans]|uniref:Gephyrin-like molybdotransferase receptor GlpR n=1 Tax=Prauserella oleivorans TaxID=1478153 RepID=A0ABW5WGG7_9PSEU